MAEESRASDDAIVSLNPQPLPPGGLPEGLGLELQGLTSVVRVPGFEDAPIAAAVLRDGSRLVLDLRNDMARVAGTFEGPIGTFDICQDWALGTDRDRVTAYRIVRA